jgi:uncharacterized MnhB-related membrane protein
MMSNLAAQASPWIAAALIFLTLAAALAVLTARSLFSVGIGIAAMCACAAGALLALGYGDGALAFALFGAGLAPVLLLGGVLLSSRAARPRARRLPWLTIAAAVVAGGTMLWASPALVAEQPIASSRDGIPLGLVALVFVSVAACVALLGYGERGVFGGSRKRDA